MKTGRYIVALLCLIPMSLAAKAPTVTPLKGNLVSEHLAGTWLVDDTLTQEMKKGSKVKFSALEFTSNPELLSKLPDNKQKGLAIVTGQDPVIAAGAVTLTIGAGKTVTGIYAVTTKGGHTLAMLFLTPPGKPEYSNTDTTFLTLVPGAGGDRLFLFASQPDGDKIYPRAKNGAIALKRAADKK